MLDQPTIVHLSAWASLCSSIIAIPAILLAATSGPRAREHVLEYQEHLSQPSFLARAFAFSYNRSTALFGPRLLSWRAFAWGFVISLSVFVASLMFTFLITPNFSITFGDYGTSLLFNIVNIYDASFSILLTLCGLVFEFIFVVKSRWLLRLLKTALPWYACLGVGILDIVTTYILFLIVTPLFLIFFSYTAMLPIHSLLDSDYITISDTRTVDSRTAERLHVSITRPMHITTNQIFNVSGHPIQTKIVDRQQNKVTLPNTSVINLYEILFLTLADIALDHITEHFASYHSISVGNLLKEEYWVTQSDYNKAHPGQVSEEFNTDADAAGSVSIDIRANYPLTSMLITASSTTIWMGCCVIILTVMRCIRAPKSSYIWIAEHHQLIWACVIFPLLAIYVIGIGAILADGF